MGDIKTIEINNFKSIRHLKMEGCRRINLLIGPPNVGKSNILEGLSCYAFAASNFHSDRSVKSLFRLEILPHLFHNLDIRKPFNIDLNEVRLKGTYTKGPEYADSKDVHGHRDEGLKIDCSEKDNSQIDANIFSYFVNKDLAASNLYFNPSKFKEPNLYNFPLGNICKYIYNNEKVGKKGNEYLDLTSPFGDNLYSFLRYNDELKRELGILLNTYNLELIFDESSGMMKVLKHTEEGTRSLIPFDLLADTIKRLFFYKAAIAGNQKAVLLFEEPEAHSFPPYISKLVSDIIFDKNENQYFIATHSPYVLNDFMENAMEDLAVFIVNQNKGATMSAHSLSKEELHEAYQYGYDFFMNMENFRPENETYA